MDMFYFFVWFCFSVTLFCLLY